MIERDDVTVHPLPSARRTADAAPLSYRRPGSPGLVEVARVEGADVALPTHFHDEDQVTFVVTGRRRFNIGGTLVEIGAGRAILIAAGTPHGSLDEPDGVICFNAYLPAVGGAGAGAGHAVAELVAGSIREAAAGAGISREAFSRSFRRTYGVAPSTFRGLARLNRARHLLRSGLPLAETAAAAGFADQSHLGRCFRHAFGVTPGVFRAGFTGSHPFQTKPRPGS